MFTFTSQKHLSCLPFVNKLQKIEYAARKFMYFFGYKMGKVSVQKDQRMHW